MAKIGILTSISILLNLFLTFWLINQYLSDIYFQQYVNQTVGQYYAFIVLTIGVGGGSALGYLFLRRKDSNQSLVSKIQKSKSFKPVSPLSTSGSIATPRSTLPSGAPPAPASKHTVYAVPPLPKSSTPSSSRIVPSATWSAASKPSLEPFPGQKQETLRPAQSTQPSSRIEPSKPSASPFSSTPQPQPIRSTPEPATRPTPSWASTPSPMGEKRTEPGPIFQKPGMDTAARQEAPFSPASGQAPQP